MSPPLRLGTRKSALAIAQSTLVAEALTAHTGRQVELVGVTTFGDVSTAHLAQIGGVGVFVNALREALLAGEIDFAVHSLKDLPTARPAGIALAAVPPREDPRDALVCAGGTKLADLPTGARVGTGSPRRVAQLRRLRPDLTYLPVRGNADTRLGKVHSGALDAVVLACAGLARLGRLDEITEAFEPQELLPAPGQGALAVECRDDHDDLLALLGTLDHAATRAAVTAERAVLAALEAGCSAPVGAYAVGNPDASLHLTAAVIAPDGGAAVRMSAIGPADRAERLGRALAADMLAHGAGSLMGVGDP